MQNRFCLIHDLLLAYSHCDSYGIFLIVLHKTKKNTKNLEDNKKTIFAV